MGCRLNNQQREERGTALSFSLGGLINARGLKKIDDFQEKHQ
jgi:hypothetical protein